VMNSGAYSFITITKSLTIDGTGHLASVLASGTVGITINITNAADVDKTVRLRGLSINGAPSSVSGPGTKGIRIMAADKVYVEDCVIDGFNTSGGTNGRGISDERIVAGGKLFVTNTTVRNNGSNGIIILPSSGSAQLIAVLDRVVSIGNTASGVYAGSGSRVTIKDSNITGNGNAGVQADETAGSTEVTIERTVISHNLFGIYAGAGNSTVRMSETTVTHNTNGLEFAGGTIHTFGNCRIAGNTNDNGPPTSAILEQ
jgi:hypothetical protein